jgi:hypothetical protein
MNDAKTVTPIEWTSPPRSTRRRTLGRYFAILAWIYMVYAVALPVLRDAWDAPVGPLVVGLAFCAVMTYGLYRLTFISRSFVGNVRMEASGVTVQVIHSKNLFTSIERRQVVLGWEDVTRVEFAEVSESDVPTVVVGVKEGSLGKIGKLSHSYPTAMEARDVVAKIDSLRSGGVGERA